MKKLLLSLVFLFTCFVGYSQTVITDEDFDKKVTNGDAFGDEDYSIIVVEFWASFNDANAFKEWDKLEGCKYYRVDISKSPRAKKEHSVRTIPHIIIFKDGEEVARFQADLSFKMLATKEEVQEEIDNQLMSDF